MKCPKCHYLSFDPEPRCRNCGYTMALEEMDLVIKPDEPVATDLVDLDLRRNEPLEALAPDMTGALEPAESSKRAVAPRRRRKAVTRGPFDEPEAVALGGLIEAGAMSTDLGMDASPSSDFETEAAPAIPQPPARPARSSLPPATAELPLFVKALATQEPPVVADVAPIPEMGLPSVSVADEVPPAVVVRRTTVEAPRLISPTSHDASRKLGPLDRDLLEDLQRIETNERREADAEAQAARRADNVGAASRLGAAALDAVLLGGLATAVLWTTLRWCDLSFGQLGTLPIAPTLAFLLLVGLGYLLLFTAAGGQTVGKMLFGIRVVREGHGEVTEMLSVKQAMYREVIALPSILALGLGFVPALIGDERALHDRIAHTRVVRA